MSNLYMMAQCDKCIGITPCMPILEQKDLNEGPRFYGALCMDIIIAHTQKYVNKEIETKGFMFNTDEEFNKATEEKSFLGFKTISERSR